MISILLKPAALYRALRISAAAALVVAACPLPSASETYTVRLDGSGHFTTIEAAVACCREGDTVLVGPGSHVIPRYGIDPDGLNIVIISEEGPDVTTIDATDQLRAFHYRTLESRSSRIEGFTIQGAEDVALKCEWASPTVVNCRFIDNELGVYAGRESSVALSECTFVGNAEEGAMIVGNSSPDLTNCSFEGNGSTGLVLFLAPQSMVTNCSFTDNGGRGMSVRHETTGSVTGCTFVGNAGGLWSEGSSVVVTDCVFEDNHVDEHGGGLCCTEGSVLTLSDCRIGGNSAQFGGGVYSVGSSLAFVGCTLAGNASTLWGGAVCAEISDPLSFYGCSFYDNTSYRGGAMLCSWSSPTIERCTFAGNAGQDAGGIACLAEGNPQVSNSIIAFGGAGAAFFCQGGAPVVNHSVVFGNAAGDSLCGSHSENMYVDPLFCDLQNGDLSLCENSPCLPAGNVWSVHIGALDAGCGECGSPVTEMTWGAIKVMFR